MKNTIESFAEAILSLDPDFPMSPQEIQANVRKYGVDRFLEKKREHTDSLMETVNLMQNLEKGAGSHGSEKSIS